VTYISNPLHIDADQWWFGWIRILGFTRS